MINSIDAIVIQQTVHAARTILIARLMVMRRKSKREVRPSHNKLNWMLRSAVRLGCEIMLMTNKFINIIVDVMYDGADVNASWVGKVWSMGVSNIFLPPLKKQFSCS